MLKKNIPCCPTAASALKSGGAAGPPIPVAVLLGPTAAGKSACALRIAQDTGWEILSCDSRQIYRGMDIGTAKPTREELSRVRHWLINILDPSEEYSAQQFARDAAAIIRERAAAGKRVLVCGGSGLYFKALCEGLKDIEASDPAVREALMARAKIIGCEAMHRELQSVDPVSAQRIHVNDLQRIVRALAVFRQTGNPMSSINDKPHPPDDMRFIVASITMPRLELYEKIGRRVDEMFRAGLWEEFLRLRSSGFDRRSPSMMSVGYRELFDVEEGRLSLEAAVELIKRNSRRYAKRQITWIKHQTAGRQFKAPVEWEAVRDYFLKE